MRIIHGEGFRTKEKEDARDTIVSNLVITIYLIVSQMDLHKNQDDDSIKLTNLSRHLLSLMSASEEKEVSQYIYELDSGEGKMYGSHRHTHYRQHSQEILSIHPLKQLPREDCWGRSGPTTSSETASAPSLSTSCRTPPSTSSATSREYWLTASCRPVRTSSGWGERPREYRKLSSPSERSTSDWWTLEVRGQRGRSGSIVLRTSHQLFLSPPWPSTTSSWWRTRQSTD